jgi:hypothetical protein
MYVTPTAMATSQHVAMLSVTSNASSGNLKSPNAMGYTSGYSGNGCGVDSSSMDLPSRRTSLLCQSSVTAGGEFEPTLINLGYPTSTSRYSSVASWVSEMSTATQSKSDDTTTAPPGWPANTNRQTNSVMASIVKGDYGYSFRKHVKSNWSFGTKNPVSLPDKETTCLLKNQPTAIDGTGAQATVYRCSAPEMDGSPLYQALPDSVSYADGCGYYYGSLSDVSRWRLPKDGDEYKGEKNRSKDVVDKELESLQQPLRRRCW